MSSLPGKACAALVGLWLAAYAGIAGAQSPAGCTTNNVGTVVTGTPPSVAPGDTVTYEASISNLDDPSISAVACDAEDIDVVFYCPGPDGRPDFSNPTVITTNLFLPAGTPPSSIGGALTCTIDLNPGVTVATVRFRVGDRSGDLDDPTEGRSLTDGAGGQPFRRDQIVLTEVPGNATPTTSSTLPPVCGNGVVEGQEECDPGPTDTDCCSVSLGCFVFKPNLGHACGVQTPGPCEPGGVCVADGTCQSTLTPADPPIRCRPASNVCDLGDFCDGIDSSCPTSHVCREDVAPRAGGAGIDVTCTAPTTVEGNFTCSAVAFDPPAASQHRADHAGVVEVANCGKRRYTRKKRVQLQPTGDAQSVAGQLNLPLTPAARHALGEGPVDACVVVHTKFAGGLVGTTRRLVTLTP